MKKFLILPIIFLSIFLIPNVKADTIIHTVKNDYPSNTYCADGCALSREEAYNDVISLYNNTLKKDYQYYVISFSSIQGDNRFSLIAFNDKSYVSNISSDDFYITLDNSVSVFFSYYGENLYIDETTSSNSFPLFSTSDDGDKYYSYYESNFDFKLSGASFSIKGVYSDDITLNSGDIIPTFKDLKTSSSWADYQASNNSNFKTVNLDDYHYVILSLKDYSKKKAFSSNLQVKGMIGITPVYNYGQTEKSEITDRCNLSYNDFTDYRLFILENDLKNNAVYLVKECENNSAFKYDTSVFDITYVTDDNLNDPVISIDGKEYHTIPFNSLTNSANANEENNFVPGSSCPVGDFNCQSSNTSTISDILNNVTNTLQSVWETLTTFMGLVTRFFNTLPVEIRAIAISSFTIMCVLGIIKFIKG